MFIDKGKPIVIILFSLFLSITLSCNDDNFPIVNPLQIINSNISAYLRGSTSNIPLKVSETSECTFTVEPGQLPSGLSLSSNGIITGVSNDLAQSYTFKVTVSSTFGESETTQCTLPVVDNDWTILIHMAVDNNIDYTHERINGIVSDYILTLKNFKLLNSGNVQVCILFDGYNNDIEGIEYTSPHKDGYYLISATGTLNDDLKVVKSEVQSGTVGDSELFFKWVKSIAPARHYLYSIFNHGGGFDDPDITGVLGSLSRSIAVDASANNDSLSHQELRLTLESFGVEFGKQPDIFFPYACLMGGVELAYEIKGLTDYLVVSEEEFPVDTWSYEALKLINSNPLIAPIDLAKGFVDSAYLELNEKKSFILSVIDMSKVDALVQSIHAYGSLSTTALANDAALGQYFNNAALASTSMGAVSFLPNHYYIDAKEYFTAISNTTELDPLKSAASLVNTKLTECVVYSKAYNYDNLGGLSVFHPIWRSRYQYSTDTYKNILLFGESENKINWTDYISKMVSLEQVESSADEFESIESTGGNYLYNGMLPQNHTLHSVNGSADVDLFLINGTTIPEGTALRVDLTQNIKETDCMITLLDSYGNIVLKKITNNGSLYPSIMWTHQTNELYYVFVQGYSHRDGDYTINFQYQNDDVYDIAGDDLLNSTTNNMLPNDLKQNHRFSPVGEADWIRLDLSSYSGAQITITLSAWEVESRPVLQFLDKTDNLIKMVDNIDTGVYPSYVFICTEPDIYYIKVLDSWKRGGDYSIEVTSP